MRLNILKKENVGIVYLAGMLSSYVSSTWYHGSRNLADSVTKGRDIKKRLSIPDSQSLLTLNLIL
ncbi:hypothetical protein E5356_13810 [Bacteroides acidifaciens]|uniref:Uncharacterized protein n=1 Tax=Bacteroides acidifaciens TaxID=85831 RepID=A0A4S2AJ81_9BACE|nr:hypothetical protein E5356_13810 [Bacteroides acidifaciens]